MNFSPNHKTLEYIYTICENKTTCSDEFKSAKHKFLNIQLQKRTIGVYSINGEEFEFDQNVILYLRTLRDIISSDVPYNQKINTVFKEIVAMLNAIELSFYTIRKEQNNVFMLRPTEFFTFFSKIKKHDTLIYEIYINLAKEYLNQLEYMAYTIINKVDELNYDLKSYSNDFFNMFIEIHEPEKANDCN
uniref:Uncharacterized protein n=1 Tax=viral metagenome TaxID=1070528 RepID=A0A6C0B6A4_9ZZZZ